MDDSQSPRPWLASCVALVTAWLIVLTAAAPAGACLLAKRLRVVAPHLTEEEVMLYAHGNMNPLKSHYELAAKTVCVGGQADIFTCSGVDLLGHLNLSEIGGGSGNDLWGWTDPVTGAEIAIIGRTNGTSFVDVSDPENPLYLGNLPSHSGSSSWRDIKTFADHAFVVADGQPHGIQVFDLTQLRSVSSPPVTFSATTHYGAIGNAHNIVINEATGFAYAVGSDNCSGGLYMVDINTPTLPTFAGCFSADGYTHDAQCVVYNGPDAQHTGKEICFASNEDTLTIVDVSSKGNPIQLSRTDYTQPGDSHYAHQGWLTEDQSYFVFDDEFDEMGQGHNTRTYVWDVSDLDNVTMSGSWDAAGSSIDHNQYIRGNFTFQANYARGLRILELTDLGNAGLTEAGFFDTYPESDGNNFDGAWSTYPFFGSGIVLVSDINRGLFILNPVVTDPNNAPALTISAPADGSSSTVGDSITFTGSANDVEDGDLTAGLVWNSSIDGNIGSGASFSTTTLSAGNHAITAAAIDSGGKTGSSLISIDVAPTGGGPQTAIYNAGLGAPSCAAVGSSCDSAALLDGRASNGPEPNQPNTLDSCADGTSGSYHSDESNDRLVVTNLAAADLVEGATVRVDATVWAWSTPSADSLDLYHAADANNPTWVLIGSITPTVSGQQTLSATYTLPAGSLQAVRANFRYQGSQSPCSGGSYDDADDLVFAVASASVCTLDADCDDGAYCNGAETCNVGTGACEAGTAVACEDGVNCTVDSCNETTDSCESATDDSACDNGAYCDGAETCDAVLGCQAGTAVDCDDGVACTVDSCNETSDSCDNPTDNGVCQNGVFCDGAEVCDPVLGCQTGGDPCPGQSCDEAGDICVECFVDGDCDDGLFCNGSETCNGASCQAGSDPCPGQGCDEGGDVCVAANPAILMSFRSNTAVPGVGTVADEDIVSHDEGAGTWALEFDGSDVGLGSLEISGLAVLPSGDLLLSFTQPGTVGGLAVDDSDIVQFTPTSLGATTAGTFSLYFDGSDVSLTSNGEDIDAIMLAADGRLIISTTGGFSGTGASGADEDLWIFTGTLGDSTSGSFAQHFDGSDVGLGGNSAEDIDAATLTGAGELLFSTLGDFSVTGLVGSDEDVVEFSGTFGSATSGSFSMRLDLSALGIATNEDIGSLHIGGSGI